MIAGLGSGGHLQALTRTWDGGTGGTGSEIGTAANWSGDILPSANGDTAEWNGSVTGNLTLAYALGGLAGSAGNAGINLSLTAAQTGNLAIDSGASATGIRLNSITIAAGAGALSLGNGANTFNFTLGGAAGTRTWTNDSASTATINSDVIFGAGGAGAQTLAIGGSGNWAIAAPLYLTNNTGANSVTLTKSGTGTLTLTASNANSCYGPVTVNGGTIVAGVAGGNPQYGAFEKTTLLTINAGAKVQAMGANAFSGWSGGSLPVTINGGELAVGNGVSAAGNHLLAALTLNGGTISGLGDPIWGGFNLTADVSVTDNSTINVTNTDTANTARTITVGAGKTLAWSGTIHNGNNNAWTTTLTFAGAGTTVLSGNNTHSGVTTINGGTLQVGSGSTSGTLGSGAVTNNATLAFNRSDDISVTQAISGTGSLQKLGGGMLTLANVMTYSGATIVNNGALVLHPSTGALNPLTAVTLAAGTKLDLRSSAANRTQTVASLTTSGSTLDFSIIGSSADQLAVTGAATLGGSNTLKLSGSASPGSYTLIATGAALAGTVVLDTSEVPGGFTTYSGGFSGNNYVVTVTGNATPGSAYWLGDLSGSWADSSLAPANSNWASDAAGTTDTHQIPAATSNVFFAADGAAHHATTLGADFTVNSLTFSPGSFSVGGSNALTINGTNSGGNALEVQYGATATLSVAASAWSGSTLVAQGGTLVAAASTALGSATSPIEVEGDLILDANLTKGDLTGNGNIKAGASGTWTYGVTSATGSTFGGVLQDDVGTLAITKNGIGWLTLTASATYTGATTVNAGRLQIGNGGSTGSIGSGPIYLVAGGSVAWNRADDTTIANDITGAGGVVGKDGTGTLTLTGNNNFATAGGSGFVISDGKVVLGSATAVPNNVVIGLRGGKLDLNGNNLICGWLDGVVGSVLTDDTATLGTTMVTLNVGGSPVYAGAINDGANGRILAVAKTGAGTETLSGTSNYTGGTRLAAGLLQANSSAALGSGLVNIPGNNTDITRLQLGNGVTLSNNIEIGVPSRTNFNGALSMPGASDSATVTGSIFVKASGLTGGTTNGGALFGPTGSGLLTLSGAVDTDSASTQVLVRGGNVRVHTAGSATNWRVEGALSLGADNALNTSSVLAMAGSNAASFDLNGFNQTLAGLGSSTAIGNTATATVTNTSPTPVLLTLNTHSSVDYSTYTAVLPLGSIGTNVLDADTVLAGNLSLTKGGDGTAQLQGPSTFIGNVVISSGTLVADRANNINLPTSSALGNPQSDRSITVNSGATLKFLQGDTFGSATTTVVATLVVNAGGTVTNNGNNFTTFGPVVLNGGTLTTTGGAIGGYQSYNLLGTVSVGGSSASAITVTGPGNAFNGVHLDTATTFDVADATTDPAPDLVVSAPLIDRNASLGGAGGLIKAGPGTMSLAVAASYTGPTEVQAGVLSLSNISLADAADVKISAGATLNLNFAGTDTVHALYLGGVLQYAGVWGAVSSGAQHESSAITGTGTLTVTSGATPPSPYGTWAASYGMDPLTDGAPAADKDNDGVNNLLEYALFSNPTVAGSLPGLTVAADGTDLTLTYRRAKLATDVTFIAEWSADLATWSTVDLTDTPTGIEDADTVEHRASVAKGSDMAKFLRVRVTQP